MAATKDQSCQVIDARPAAAFAEGSIPGSVNVPASSFFKEDGCVKNAVEIKALFEAAGADFKKPVAFCCMGGVQACVPFTASQGLWQNQDVAVYDGSYAEWKSK